jgi:1-acyl-sn-glycerol-3-phosphate acyltransferase
MIILRSALFNLYFFGLSLVLTLAGAVTCLLLGRPVMPLARLWARLALDGARIICGIRLVVVGREHLPAAEALIASRHQSAFDTLVWLTLVPCCCYVLKQELLRIPLFGSLIRRSGMIAIDRQGGAAALRQMVRQGERAVRERRQIVIFPEGTRAEPGRILPLHPGVAALAARSGLPIVPVVTDSGLYWGRRAFRKRPGRIHVRILPPLDSHGSHREVLARLEDAFRTNPELALIPVDKTVGSESAHAEQVHNVAR